MLHNRYHEEYESDFQYHLRREMNSIDRYIPVYLTPSGEWYYDEPSGDYITIHVQVNSTQSNIDKVCKQLMSLLQYPF